MSRNPSDSFLPSGAILLPPRSFPSSSSMISPTTVPRSMPDYMSPPTDRSSRSISPNRQPKPYSLAQHSSHHSPGSQKPISPPKTRSASAENDSEALIEDWRNYTRQLRSQTEGEKAHMMADRKRMEEVMAEERALWEKEREILKARIRELENQLEGRGPGVEMNMALGQITQRLSIQEHMLNFTSPGSNAVSVTSSTDGAASRSLSIPQESGRNADGSPFYAPAARNPSRTFSSSETEGLRVDSITAPRESAIRVTSKELTSSDFGPQSPGSSHELETILESLPESIDISLIQPELEGVSIKASAVAPSFAAKILSPLYSPSKLSPNIKPPERDVSALSPLSKSGSHRDGKGLQLKQEVLYAPVDRRLTMHAGHTPNHSITKFDIGESGSATPTQKNTEANHHNGHHDDRDEHDHGHHLAVATHFGGDDADERGYGNLDEDIELSGPLGLTNEKSKDDLFLAQLVEKLEEARRSEGVSPSSESVDSRRSDEEVSKGSGKETDELPPLRLKPSSNFGRPLGSM